MIKWENSLERLEWENNSCLQNLKLTLEGYDTHLYLKEKKIYYVFNVTIFWVFLPHNKISETVYALNRL